MFDVKKMGKRIKELRGERSQTECAELLGISRGALSFYENGERKPDADVIYAMCQVFGVTSDYLLGLSNLENLEINIQELQNTGLSNKSINKLVELNSTIDELKILKYDKRTFYYGFDGQEFCDKNRYDLLNYLIENDNIRKLLDTLLLFEIDINTIGSDEAYSRSHILKNSYDYIEYKLSKEIYDLLKNAANDYCVKSDFYNRYKEYCANEQPSDEEIKEALDNAQHNPKNE
ncbi:MAG: helix-turn-helix transcriptional regulator [Oscillospiraceae bacterium]|nr:helix-turn-helix transcriptional regulator [Oscillospiraceae bacterium]